jgi:4'-phosphopantetheinyl transferase
MNECMENAISDTHVFFTKISETFHNHLLNTHLNRFPDTFQDKIKKFRRWQDAQLCLLGRLLVEAGIKKLTGRREIWKDIIYNKYGKPYLNDNLLYFNISHSDKIVVCALHGSEIGIDIERQTNGIEPAEFKQQMTDDEWMKIVSSPNRFFAFYKYWTEKEAVIKKTGKGLSIPLNSFVINNNSTQIENQTIYTRQIFIDEDYLCSIAGGQFHQIIISAVDTNFYHD